MKKRKNIPFTWFSFVGYIQPCVCVLFWINQYNNDSLNDNCNMAPYRTAKKMTKCGNEKENYRVLDITHSIPRCFALTENISSGITIFVRFWQTKICASRYNIRHWRPLVSIHAIIENKRHLTSNMRITRLTARRYLWAN